MSLGMQWAGIDVVGGVEHNPHAVAAYKHNLGDHVVCADIKEFSPEAMEAHLVGCGSISSAAEIDVVFGGPPCPGFSNIGRSKISSLIKSGEWEGSDHRHKFIDDERNELFREFVKYVEHFQPQVFVMENVKGMKSYETKKHGTIVDIIEAEFRRLGYEAEVDVMDSSGFGVAQNRQRLSSWERERRQNSRIPILLPGRFPFLMLLQICLRLTRSPVHQRVNCLSRSRTSGVQNEGNRCSGI